jgi:hypothetical protein
MKHQQFFFSKSIAALFVAIACLVFSCQEIQTDPPTQLTDDLRVNEGSGLVPGMYIVTLHDNSKELNGFSFRKSGSYEDMQSGMRKVAVDVVRKHQLSSENIKTVFGSALTGFTVFLSENELAELRKDPSVKSIVQDRYMVGAQSMRKTSPGKGGGSEPEPDPQPEPVIPVPWNLDRIDQRSLPLDGKYLPPNPAYTVIAYIIGSAINLNHVEFEGRATNVDLTNGGVGFTNPNPLATEIAGVIGGKKVGAAKGINLIGVVSYTQNSYGSDQEGILSEMLTGLDWIHANATKPSVVYLPASGPKDNISAELLALINNTLDALFDKGLSIFAVAGSQNEDACTWLFPSHPGVFTTGMTDKNDYIRLNSNYGSCIDVFAPGVEILTADGLTNDGYRYGNPVVITTAQTMGVAAMYLQTNPTASPQQVYDFLKATSTKNVVKLAKSPNNHLLFSGLNTTGAGQIDPSSNYDFELIGSSVKVSGTTWRVNLRWTPIEGDRLTLFVDGVENGSIQNSGNFSLEVKGKTIAPKTYKLCVPGTTNCSNTVTVNF